MSAVGPGAAVFDANGDGLQDIYIPNGNWLLGPQKDQFYAGDDRPRNALYIQQKDGKFVDEAKARGVDHDAWAFGACAADLDNDGDQDLIVTNLSYELSLHQRRVPASSPTSPKEAGIAGKQGGLVHRHRVSRDYDKRRPVSTSTSPELRGPLQVDEGRHKDIQAQAGHRARSSTPPTCVWQGLEVYCGPRWVSPGSRTTSVPQQGRQVERKLRFEDVTKKTGHLASRRADAVPLYGFQVLFTDLNRGRVARHLHRERLGAVVLFRKRTRARSSPRSRAASTTIAVGETGRRHGRHGRRLSADINNDGWPDRPQDELFALQTNNLYVCRAPTRTRAGKWILTFHDYSVHALRYQAGGLSGPRLGGAGLRLRQLDGRPRHLLRQRARLPGGRPRRRRRQAGNELRPAKTRCCAMTRKTGACASRR